MLDCGADINAQSYSGWTPLHIAFRENRKDMVKLLLREGADINLKDEYGWEAWYYAPQKGYIDVMRPSGPITSKNVSFCPPVHPKSTEIINAKNDDGRNPFHLASYCGRTDIVKLLLERGYDADATSGAGSTPLHYASYRGHKDIVQLLLEHGVNVNAVDQAGRTPLHMASCLANEDLVELLLENNANANIRGINGRTALHYASSNFHKATIKVLLEHNADVNIEDNSGKKPSDICREEDYYDLAEFIENHIKESISQFSYCVIC